MKYDIFISYRRNGGFETAKHLYDLLTRDGYSVSFDIDTLRNGDFNSALFARIDECKDFIVILDKEVFSRTIDGVPKQRDWLRQELSRALEKGKNVIPIILNGFEAFPDNLPSDIAAIAYKNGPKYDISYFDAFYQRLKSFLTSSVCEKPVIQAGKRTKPLLWMIPAVMAIAIAVFSLVRSHNTIFRYKNNGLEISVKNLSHVQQRALKDILDGMVFIEEGFFVMGRTSEQNRYLTRQDSMSVPPHNVALSGYYIGRAEVTQMQWSAFLPKVESSQNQGLDNPVDYVSWEEAKAFADTLSAICGLHFDLPTEAQWEYAARAGETRYLFAGTDNASEAGWLKSANGRGIPHPGQQLKPNSYGLYDMTGNVDEWCLDYFGDYSSMDSVNPTGPISGSSRVFRGGSIFTHKWDAKVSSRHHYVQSLKRASTGLRLVIIPEK